MGCKDISFEKLELLDLKKRHSVAEIVEGLSGCSFGARQLGDTTARIQHIIEHNASSSSSRPSGRIVYDGTPDGALAGLLGRFADKNGFGLMNAAAYESAPQANNLVVVGRFSPRNEKKLFIGGKHNTIFINEEGMAAPEQIRDGYFPNVIFSDPAYILPIIDATLDERLRGKKTTVSELFAEMPAYGGQAALVTLGAKNVLRMVEDPTYTLFFTMSGAMTIAQMSLVLTDMIEQGMIQSLTTTGAAMAHGLVAGSGLSHYKHDPSIPDSVLTKKLLNRVTDTLEPETNFDHIDHILHAVLADVKVKSLSPSQFHERVGKYLAKYHPNEPGILRAAYQQGVPVFVPAFYDSELGNDITTHNKYEALQHKRKIHFDLERDNWRLVNMVQDAHRIGIFTVGGGVPRNWTQNVAPLIEIINNRTDLGLKEKQFSSGVRIAPDAMYHGHLSGCTYGEGMTWRKFDPNGVFIEIKNDATVTWPFITKYVMEQRPAN
jgi:deoxyhypusine synthase